MSIFTELTAWHWLSFGLFFLVLELISGTGFLLWMGLASVVVGITLFFVPLGWVLQWLVFSCFTIISAILWWWFLRHSRSKLRETFLNQRSAQYIGREATLEAPIVNGRGKIHINDSVWPVIGPDLPAGTRVQVVGVDGVLLKVEAIPSE